MNKEVLASIIGREENPLDNENDLEGLLHSRILVTGGLGSLGQSISKIFDSKNLTYKLTDKDDCDVTSLDSLFEVFDSFKPTHVLHLAADKHAPEGELDPELTFKINTIGTLNLISLAQQFKTSITIASTCKSCDPETVYGSSKLIAERIVLNAGGVIARFFNVVDTSGNVFEIWNKVPPKEQIPVSECFRYFMTSQEACSLLIRCINLSTAGTGRYIFEPGISHYMPDIAKRIFPERNLVIIPPRRGDRKVEPLKSASERLLKVEGRLIKVVSPHDPIINNQQK